MKIKLLYRCNQYQSYKMQDTFGKYSVQVIPSKIIIFKFNWNDNKCNRTYYRLAFLNPSKPTEILGSSALSPSSTACNFS